MRIQILTIFIVSFFLTIGLAQTGKPAKYVVLISIDGFRPDFYLQDQWPTPTLKAMAKSGAHAKGLRPVLPSITLPDHTSMITGALPARHGIYYNAPFNPLNWKTTDYKNADEIKTPTLWDAVKKAGGTSAAVRWVVAANHPAINWHIWADYEPESIFPKGFLEELEQNLIGKRRPDKEQNDYDYYYTDLQSASIVSYLIKKYQPNFITARVRCTDYFQHEQGRAGYKVEKAIQMADVYVGQIVEATKAAGIYEETAFIIVGDHGFEDRHTEIAWNTLLISEGLLSAAPDRGNWKACFHDQFLILKDSNDKATLQTVRNLLENQPHSIRKLYRIVERAELDHLGVAPEVALAVQPIEGIYCTSRYSGTELLQPASGGMHGNLPDRTNLYSGFIAHGAGIRSRTVVPILNMEDIAPLIAHLLQLDFHAPDGVLLPGLIEQK